MKQLFRILFIFGVVVLLNQLATRFVAATAEDVQQKTTLSTSSIVMLTNKDRARFGLPALQNDKKLEEAAQKKAEDMARNQYFSHTTQDNKKAWSFIAKAGYQFGAAGENLAVKFSDPEKIENAWMKSDDHRDNILDKDFEDIGIGIAYGVYKGVPTYYVVQLFGTKL